MREERQGLAKTEPWCFECVGVGELLKGQAVCLGRVGDQHFLNATAWPLLAFLPCMHVGGQLDVWLPWEVNALGLREENFLRCLK